MENKLLNNNNDVENNDFSSCEFMKMHLTGHGGYEKNYQTAIDYLFKSLDDGSEQCKNDYYEIITLQKEYGKRFEDRIYIIEEKGGIPVEYELIDKLLGERDVDFFIVKQEVKHINGSWVDIMYVKLLSDVEVTYYFDITRFFGK